MAQDTPPKDSNECEEPLFIQVWRSFYESREDEETESKSVGDESEQVD